MLSELAETAATPCYLFVDEIQKWKYQPSKKDVELCPQDELNNSSKIHENCRRILCNVIHQTLCCVMSTFTEGLMTKEETNGSGRKVVSLPMRLLNQKESLELLYPASMNLVSLSDHHGANESAFYTALCHLCAGHPRSLVLLSEILRKNSELQCPVSLLIYVMSVI